MQAEIATVDVQLSVKVPVKFYQFLRGLGQFVGHTPEEILTSEVYQTMSSFIQGGYVESWVDPVLEENRDLKQLVDQVQEQINSDE